MSQKNSSTSKLISKPKVEVVMESSIQVISSSDLGEHQQQPYQAAQLQQQPQQQQSFERQLSPPSLVSRYTCVAILIGILSIWGKYVFINEDDIPDGRTIHIHNGFIPFTLTALYVISLPILHAITKYYNIHNKVDIKLMLRESMIIYNAVQVILNGWMVYRIVYALLWNHHPFIAGPIHLVNTGAAYAVWVHYCDKYLEFLDTYFMILRGKMDQV
jgi:elongation of very long chain fatty acids protein 4